MFGGRLFGRWLSFAILAWLVPSAAFAQPAGDRDEGMQVLRCASLSSRTIDASALTEAAPKGAQAGPCRDGEVALPHAWNPRQLEGIATYELTFRATVSDAARGMGAYVPRAGNRIEFKLNGVVVERMGRLEMDDRADFAQHAQFVFLPPMALLQGVNRLEVTLAGERARFAGLSTVQVGPVEEVRSLYQFRHTAQTKGSMAVMVVSLLFAVVALPLLARWREPAVGYFVLTCVLCALRTAYFVVIEPPMPYTWWALVTDFAYAGYLMALGAFTIETVRAPRRLVVWPLVVLALATVVLVPSFAFGRVITARQIWLQFMVVVSSWMCALIMWQAWRLRTRETILMALAAFGAVAMGVYDHVLVFYMREGYSSFGLARYSLGLFLLAMGWVLLDRRWRLEDQVQQSRRQISSEVASHVARLDAAFDIQQKMLAEGAHKAERVRLLQDLHDGIGLELQGLLASIESGNAQQAELATDVRTAIEQMRMLVHNEDAFDGDMLMLFGQIRHQIQRRLEAAGIKLVWDSKLAGHELRLLPGHAVAIQRLVFELTTNVMRHAKAKRMTVRLEPRPAGESGIRLTVSDDGVGFDPRQVRPHAGMKSLTKRLSDLGAQGGFIEGVSVGTSFEAVIPNPPTDAIEAATPRSAPPGPLGSSSAAT
jgi:signal transduction histidine kinase